MAGINVLKSLSKEELKNLTLKSSSKQEILKSLNINIKNSQALKYITKFIKDNDIYFTVIRKSKRHWSYDELKPLVENNISWSGLLRDLDIKFIGNNIRTIKKLIVSYNLDTSHFDAKLAAVLNQKKYKNDDNLFKCDSSISRDVIKSRIIKSKLIPYICAGKCGIIDSWNEKPLVLQLEHKNGINNDHRLENLCFLCPNCHSQTNSYAGRNRKGCKRNKDGSFLTLQK